MGSPHTWASALALTLLGVPAAAGAQEETAAEEAAEERAAEREEAAEEADEAAEERAAEDEAEGSAVATVTTTSLTADAEGSTAVTTTAVVEEEPVVEEDDHLRVVRRFGVGLLGTASAMTVNSNFTTNRITLPTIGARYWLTERLGLQAGVGLMHQSGDNDQNTLEAGYDTPTTWAFSVHVGVPLALYHDKHYKFLVQPEANFLAVTGRTNDNVNIDGDQGVTVGGWGLDVGARVGAEVHFGFIGIPMLSLQGSVGLAYQLRQAQLTTVVGNQEVVQTKTEHVFGTAHHNDPWDLFTSSIAALYYF